MAKVESIVDPSFKSGEKNGKRWTLIKVMADGKTATGFGPISVGDEVDLEYNDQYQNYSFKRLGPQDIPTTQVETPPAASTKLLELIYSDTQKLLKLVGPQQPDNVTEDIGDGPMNLDDIPFV